MQFVRGHDYYPPISSHNIKVNFYKNDMNVLVLEWEMRTFSTNRESSWNGNNEKSIRITISKFKNIDSLVSRCPARSSITYVKSL
jgi:hypothetical protein